MQDCYWSTTSSTKGIKTLVFYSLEWKNCTIHKTCKQTLQISKIICESSFHLSEGTLCRLCCEPAALTKKKPTHLQYTHLWCPMCRRRRAQAASVLLLWTTVVGRSDLNTAVKQDGEWTLSAPKLIQTATFKKKKKPPPHRSRPPCLEATAAGLVRLSLAAERAALPGCPTWMCRGLERGARRTGLLVPTRTVNTPTALWVERVAREESLGPFLREQHPHFEETNLTVAVDSMLGAAGLQEWGDARCNMDIREGINTRKHRRGRTQVKKNTQLFASVQTLILNIAHILLLILALCSVQAAADRNFHSCHRG